MHVRVNGSLHRLAAAVQIAALAEVVALAMQVALAKAAHAGMHIRRLRTSRTRSCAAWSAATTTCPMKM